MNAGEIKDIRARLGMTQAEFARAVGVTTRAVQTWESGARTPSTPAVKVIEGLARDHESRGNPGR